MLKKYNLGFVVISVLIVSICSIQFTNLESTDLLPIETWITSMNWNIHEDILLTKENSEFDFDFDFNIYNPNDENVTLYFADSKQFVGNFSAELENENHNTSCYTGGAFLALTERTLEPGISQDNSGIFRLRFDTDSLTVLPDGNYTFWIYARSNPDVISHTTNLTVNDGEIFIDYFVTTIPTPPPTTPSLTIEISYSVICFSIIISTGFFYLIRKRKLN